MNRKRILSMLLAALLMLSTFPAALAVDENVPQVSPTAGGFDDPGPGEVPAVVTTPEGGTTEGSEGTKPEESESEVEPEIPQSPTTVETPKENVVQKKAVSRAVNGLAQLDWSDITLNWDGSGSPVNFGDIEMPAGAETDIGTVRVWGADDGNALTSDDESEDFCNIIDVSLDADSSVNAFNFSFAVPADVDAESDLFVNYYRFRPGDRYGDTIKEFPLESVTDEFTLEFPEADSPYVYRLQFVTKDEDGEPVPVSCTYAFELRVQRYEFLTWDDIDCAPISGEQEDIVWFPSTNTLFLKDNTDGQENLVEFYLKREDENTPVSGKFIVSVPEDLQDKANLKAKVWETFESEGTVEDLTADKSFEFTVEENESIKPAVQFGIMEGDEFKPLTYAHQFCFRVICLERLTWNDIDLETTAGIASQTVWSPSFDEPLYTSEDPYPNTVNIYVKPDTDDATPIVNFTIKVPESLAGNDDLFVGYYSFTRGDNTGESMSEFLTVAVDDFESIQIPMKDDKVYCFSLGVLDANNSAEFLQRTYWYDFCVNIVPITDLKWNHITATAPTGAEVTDITKNPEEGSDLYVSEEDSANIMTVNVSNAQAGDKVSFKVTYPGEDATDVVAQHITFIKGLQENPDAVFEDIELDADGSFTFDVDIIGAADETKVIHAIVFLDRDHNMVTPWYHFDFVAKTAGTVVNAEGTESEGVLSAGVEDGTISDAITSNLEETIIYVNANQEGEGITEAQITLGSDDTSKVVEDDVTLQIATPIGTVTVPAEAIEQAKGEDSNASIILEVKAVDSVEVTYQNITVTTVQNVEVTLYRVVDEEEPEAIPIQMTGSNRITVTVAIMDGLTLNETRYLVYLPKNSNGDVSNVILERTVEPADIDSNSCLTFTTSHLSEFALLSYDDAKSLGLFPTSQPSGSGGSGGGAAIVPATSGGVTLKPGSNGTVTISPNKPKEGDKVTVTVKPNAGYELDSIKATADGKNVKLTEEDDNLYSFTMPKDEVTITATFKPIESDTAPVETSTAPTFYDVASSDWYANAVGYVAERGMMAGSNGSFTPNSNLTRSMMAQILYNVETGSGSGTRTFPDVKSSDWFAGAVSWAATQGLMDGYGNGNFGPEDSITREQLASILYRYASTKGYSVSASAELSSFVDGALTSGWAEEPVRWAAGAGLLTGKSGSRLDPTGTATRAEVAQILMNFYTQVAD